MTETKKYIGLDKESEGGMTPTGNIIRDAWVFGIIPETEICAGWTLQGIDDLYDKVTRAWEPYGHLASRLPSQLHERHRRIYEAAMQRARAEGWTPQMDDED